MVERHASCPRYRFDKKTMIGRNELMYELDCTGIIPGCKRVIQADSEAEVFRRAVMQARQNGIERTTPLMRDRLRAAMRERADFPSKTTPMVVAKRSTRSGAPRVV
ncbi:DUF1059 domain-containing protein [Fulvimarina manganoxydans]|uniref:DUF1059 domain-containing protein n=1 Tax=Fulvimarina manganoxydans TaxID=937218 RepID=UPI0023559CEE|nr:DUF1059 domain-containing protein [Fulvimarina manganoxydans]